MRVGIGRPPGRMDPAVFVLRDFPAAQRRELPLLIDRAADAVETLLQAGIVAAQNVFNARQVPAFGPTIDPLPDNAQRTSTG